MSNFLRGHKAKGAGDSFEALFKAICNRTGIVCVDFPDGCIKYSTPNGLKLAPTQMPFDYLICKDGKAAAVDAKTVEQTNFCYSAIVPHQLVSLSQVGQHIPAGYVVWFRTTGDVIFFDHLKLASLKPKDSLKPSNGVNLGPIHTASFERVLDHGLRRSGNQRSLF